MNPTSWVSSRSWPKWAIVAARAQLENMPPAGLMLCTRLVDTFIWLTNVAEWVTEPGWDRDPIITRKRAKVQQGEEMFVPAQSKRAAKKQAKQEAKK